MFRGGHNREHNRVDQYRRADSYRMDSENLIINTGKQILKLEAFPNNYGGERLYFRCPICGKRVRFLYLFPDRYLRCRTCGRLNYQSQQVSSLMSVSEYRVRELYRKLGYDTQGKSMHELSRIGIPERKRYQRWETYDKLTAELRIEYQNYYHGMMQSFTL